VIYFTYQQGQTGHQVQVNYTTSAGVFATVLSYIGFVKDISYNKGKGHRAQKIAR
jgi:hypothetical protein